MVDYAMMRKNKIPFWDIFFGKPLCVAVYHIATEDTTVSPEVLSGLKSLPSQMIMDNIFYYGECEIIGNVPIAPDEDNFTIHYGRSISAVEPNFLYYQCGKTFIALENADELDLHTDNTLCGFRNGKIGLYLYISLPMLLECIKAGSNQPFWDMSPPLVSECDLRNPKYKNELKLIKEQMGIK